MRRTYNRPINFSDPKSIGLVCFLPLTEHSGKIATDKTGINYAPCYGSGFTFNNDYAKFTSGGSDYIDLGNKAPLNFTSACTISFWFNQANGLVSGVFKYGSSTTQSYRLVVNSDNKIYWIFSSNGSNALYGATSGTFSLNVLNHVTAIYNGNASTNSTRCIIYLNGVLMPLAFSGTIPTSLFQSSASVTVNRYNGTSYGNGLLKHIRMYNRVLSYSEAIKLYTDELN